MEAPFSFAPRHAPAVDHAEAWRVHLRLAPTDPIDVCSVVAGLGYELQETQLSADQGRLEASLVPSRRHGFSIRVDDRLTPNSAWEGSGTQRSAAGASHAAIQFRVAHELGHTFFFEPGVPPTRNATSGRANEEWFCDDFATCLLVPPAVAASAVAVGPVAIAQLAVSMSSPIERVLRSAEISGTAIRALGGVLLDDGRPRVDLAVGCADQGFGLMGSLPGQQELHRLRQIRATTWRTEVPFMIVEAGASAERVRIAGAVACRGWWDYSSLAA